MKEEKKKEDKDVKTTDHNKERDGYYQNEEGDFWKNMCFTKKKRKKEEGTQ